MITAQGLYNSIEELPIRIWYKIMETGDLSLLFKSDRGRPKIREEKLEDLWLNLQQQYFDEFGIDADLESRMKKIKKLTLLNYEWVATQNKRLLNKMNQLEIDLENWGKAKATGFYEAVDLMENAKGFQIDLEKMTVIRWYYAVFNLSKRAPKSGENGSN